MIDNPLASSAVTDDAAPPPPSQDVLPTAMVDPMAGFRGTAQSATGTLALLCATMLDSPLTQEERATIEAAVIPVLIKRNVPNVPLAEEINLVTTVGAIVGPRIIAKVQAARAAQQEQEEAPDDTPVDRQEGLRQKHAIANSRMPSFGRKPATSDSVL